MPLIPFMRFWVADYRADTEHLTTVQHGAYLLLIFNYWQRGRSLPNDDVLLARMARMSLKEWKKHREVIVDFFRPEQSNRFLRHNRIERELQSVRDKSLKSQKAGRASVERRFGVRSTDAEHPSNHTDSESDTPSSTIDVEEGRAPARDPVDKSLGKKRARPSPRYEFDGEEPIMATVRKEFAGSIDADYAAAFCNPARPIRFVSEDGRLLAYCHDAFTLSTVRDHEYRLAQIAKRHGFVDAWFREERPNETAPDP